MMLYFHGGGYWSGANIQYPGHFLATRDVVVVVANYRLNLFGERSYNNVAFIFRVYKISSRQISQTNPGL